MTDPAPTLFTRRVLKGQVGAPVTLQPRHNALATPISTREYVLCPSCHDPLYHDINSQWACKCGCRTKALEEIP